MVIPLAWKRDHHEVIVCELKCKSRLRMHDSYIGTIIMID